MPGNTIRIATDVGGTFTDLVYFEIDPQNGKSRIVTAKTDTTNPDYESGVLNVLEKSEISLASVKFFAHGTTVVINSLTERKGAKVGLITSEGFRDVLEIARGNRPDFFNLHYEKPKPFVSRNLRLELPGRISYKGVEVKPMDLSGLPKIVDYFRSEGVEAIAICLLHSYANTSHEKAAFSEVHKLWPDVSVVCSHQITREWREYERTSTTVLSAYVQPIAERYLSRLDNRLKEKGFANSPYIMQSNCGVASLELIKQIPVAMVESGPASGFLGAAELGKLIGEPNVLALDIGGTSAKCSLIENGQVKIMTDYWIERNKTTAGYPILVPVVDLVEIGNGGGSIAWVDEFKKLHVGPRSAGAAPGPAAYGRGGKSATTTDANLILGRINPDYFCGGEIVADMVAAQSAVAAIGKDLGVDVNEAARAIVRIANNNMINALKLVSLNRGHDPRDFTLIAFGGGGAMHAVALAQELGVKKVVVPKAAAVFSAWGMLMSDLRRDFFVTRLVDLGTGSAAEIEALFAETERTACDQYAAEGISPSQITMRRYGKFRYQNQEHTTEVEIAGGEIDEGRLPGIEAVFHLAYEREYTYRLNAPVEMVGIHLVATAEVGKLTMTERPTIGVEANLAVKGKRQVDYALEGIREATIYDGSKLEPGMTFHGPAIVEDPGTTVVIHPGDTVKIDGYGNIHIALAAAILTGITTVADNPITIEIIQSSLQATADEMFATMKKTAMSSIIYEVLDMGTGITDSQGRLASSGAGIPAFIGVLDKSVQFVVNKFTLPGEIEPGDVFATNDPYYGGVTHLNDIVVVMPVFADGHIIAWAANIAHNSDVGGKSPGSLSADATEIFQEGLRLPAIKLISSGDPIRSVFEIIKVNSRMPDVLEGDLWAAVASVRIGAKRLADLAHKYGVETFESAMKLFMDFGEMVSLAELKKLPHGTFELTEEQDNGIFYNAKITISATEFIVDLRDNPPEDYGPANTSRDGVMVCAQMIFKSLTDPYSPCNAGSFRPIKLLVTEGTAFHAKEPAALGFYFETNVRVYDLFWRCLATHVPERLAAGHFGSICGTFIGGTHPDTGRQYTIIEPQIGGWGASRGRDGNSAIFSGFHGETYNCPAEISEARNGLIVDRMELNDEPGGYGQWIGGRGIRMDYRARANGSYLTVGFTRSRILPWGLDGGSEGSPNYVNVIRTDGSRERYAFVSGVIVNKDDVIRIVTGAGGGLGDPKNRNRVAIQEDIRNGFLTEDQAKVVYGVG